jgi:hypothetical protein
VARGADFSTPRDYGYSTRFRRRGFVFRIARIWLGVRRFVRCVRSIGGGGGFACGVGRDLLLHGMTGA